MGSLSMIMLVTTTATLFFVVPRTNAFVPSRWQRGRRSAVRLQNNVSTSITSTFAASGSTYSTSNDNDGGGQENNNGADADGKLPASRKRATWEERLVELIEYKEKHGDCLVPRSHGQLGSWVQNQRAQYRLMQNGKPSPMSPERIARLEDIGFEWDASHKKGAADEDKWEERLAQLIEYKEKHGDCLVPTSHGQLGMWVMTQRAQYRKMQNKEPSHMTPERMARLEDIGFEWDASRARNLPDDDKWEERLAQLIEYKKEHGDCLVPTSHGQLGTWVMNQRTQYRLMQNGKPSPMSPERIARLEDIGFEWDASRVRNLPDDDKWEERLAQLIEYKKEHGDCLVPTSHGQLGSWVKNQRAQYRLMQNGKPSPMSPERIARLEDIGFEWDASRARNLPDDDKWEERLAQLIEYKKEHGDCLVPTSHGQLGTWVMNQRTQYRLMQNGKPSPMSPERIARLEDIGFEWDASRVRNLPDDDKWEERLAQLIEYKKEHGDCLVPTSHGQLGSWVKNQRAQYRLMQNGKPSPMSPERIARLEDIGFEWDASRARNLPDDDKWEERLAQLIEYKKEHGDCLVPTSHGQLGTWVMNQRTQYRLMQNGEPSPMSPERIARLEDIGFEWDASRVRNLPDDDKWEERLAQLIEYKEKHGDCLVPQSHGQLGKWVKNQRAQYRKMQNGEPSHMTPERIAKLEDIGFEWDASHKMGFLPDDDKWEERLQELIEYKEVNGDCLVPIHQSKLGTWVMNQRTQYRLMEEGKPSPMTPERIARLEDIGFEWQVRKRRGR